MNGSVTDLGGKTWGGMTQLMQGKRGLIMGVANDHSIAWGIARTLAAHGATLAFTYQGEALGRRLADAALRRRGRRVGRRHIRDARGAVGIARFPGPRHRVFRQERIEGPL